MAKKQKNKINWPALSTVQFNIVPDSTFNIGSGITTITPNQVSQLWGMPADSYEANRIPYPEKTVVNPHMGQNTIIYNPNTNNRDAVSLDALHVMHDSPIYQELYKQYVESLPQGFEPLMEAANDEFGNEGVTIIEKYQKGLPLSQEEQEVIEPIYDALLRRQFAPDYMRNVPHGYQDKAILPIIPSINIPGDEAIRRYMESYPLKEVTITPENKHGDGGPLHPDWNELSMKDRAAYIRMGVANGYKNIEDIINVYNEFRKGGAKQNPRESYIYEELPTLLKDAGLNVRVTSGYRPVGAVGTAGARSWHPRHGAVDIVPQGDTTFEDIENVLHNHPVVRQYMLSHNLGLLDESGRTPESKETMRRTGATGAHFHIGKDSKPAAAYRQRVGALQSTDDNKVVYFTNPFLPLEQPIESNNVVIDNTPIVPLPVNEAAILSANPYEEEITYEKTLPEVVVRPEPKIVNPQAVYEDMQALAPALTPIEPPTIPSITEKVTALSNARNAFLQNELENSIMRSQLIDDDFSREKLRRDIEDLRFYRNMSAYGGNLFPIGGPIITVNPGDRVDTDQCAAWSNGLLRDNGYLVNGNAWSLGNVDMLFNGYDGLTRPETYDSRLVTDYNHAATDNVFKNFDSKTLDTSKPYVVNMYYNNSPAQEEAYNNGKGVTGTHTGVLTFDPEVKKWYVTHNIHGNIHQEPFGELQKSSSPYGVTAIYAPREKGVWNRVKGFLGFADGGQMNTYQTGGPKGRQNITNLSTWDEMAAEVPFYYTLGKLLDPTGVTGYADAKEAISEYNTNPTLGTGYNAVMETLGSLPLINKAGKAIKVAQGLVNGQGVLNDWNYAKEMQDAYNKELVIDYWDNTVKPRGEASKHNEQMKKKMSYTDVNHLPSFELAPEGAKIGQVLPNYSINHRIVSRYKK